MIVAPRGFEDWLTTLNHAGIGASFRVATGGLLRVIAGTIDGAVCLASGREAIPYVPWLQDGLPMNSRLIVHNQCAQIDELVRPHFSTDIRVATHAQELASFLSDIEEHKFDLLALDVNELGPDVVPTVLQHLAEYGVLIGVGTEVSRSPIFQACFEEYFVSHLGGEDQSMVASRKSMQHRAARRGGRRRHTNTRRT